MTAHAITANPSRYRIEAMAPTAADVVANLGGLLFDRRRLGWDTLVLLDDCADIRPLQIIGADYADLPLTLDMPQHPRAAAIATSMQLYRSDPRVYARINAAIDGGLSEVVVWGDTDSIGRKPQLIATTHHVSQVAAAFKKHAITAARTEISGQIVVEKFMATRPTWGWPETHQQSTLNGVT
jgi:hypothetical protein